MGRVTCFNSSGRNRRVIVVSVVGQSDHGKEIIDSVPCGKAGLREAVNGGRGQETALQAAAELFGTDWREGGESRREVEQATAHDYDSCTVSAATHPREMMDANALDDCALELSVQRSGASAVRVGPPTWSARPKSLRRNHDNSRVVPGPWLSALGRVTAMRASGLHRRVIDVVCVVGQSDRGEEMMDGVSREKAGPRTAESSAAYVRRLWRRRVLSVIGKC
jgi:hypothetical protein